MVKRTFQSLRVVWIPGLAVCVFVAAWGLLVSLANIPTLLLPSPGGVWASAVLASDDLIAAGFSTFSEIVFATAIAIVGGFATGVALSLLPGLRGAIFPYILMTQVVPKVALAPILVAWFGIGVQSRLILAFLIAYFPMVINTLVGLLGTNQAMVRYMDSLAASDWQALVKVRLPAALQIGRAHV